MFVKSNGDVCPCMQLLHSSYTYLFEERRKVVSCSFGNVSENLLGDIWMSIMSMPMGVTFMLVAGAADEVWHVEGGILVWLKIIGLTLILVFALGLMLTIGLSAHASPKKEEAEMPEFADWAREDGNAVKVMYAVSCAMVLCAVVKALIVG